MQACRSKTDQYCCIQEGRIIVVTPLICQRSFLLKGIIGSLLINLVLFGSIPGLVDMDPCKKDLDCVQGVFLSRIHPESLVPKPKEPPKPKEEKIQEKIFKIQPTPRSIPREQLSLDLPQMDLSIDPRLADGVPVMTAQKMPQLSNLNIGDIIDMDKLDVIPAPSFKRQPRYPYRAKRMGIEGSVAIRFLVDKFGNVSRISVVKAEPPNLFEQSVIDAVSTWKYNPGELMGEKVATWVTTTVIFKLEND